jgi:GNAT superfamily N-acetyltransferase
MEVSSRRATAADLDDLVRLYRMLEKEILEVHPMWALSEALPEPAENAIARALEDPDSLLYVGEIDGIPFGFGLAFSRQLLPQSGGERIGVIDMVYVEPEARQVGVGEAIRLALLDEFRRRGVRRFDAISLPRSRIAKNFYEQGGFAARSIVMHRDDDRK